MDLVDFPTEEADSGRDKSEAESSESQELSHGLKMSEGDDDGLSSSQAETEAEETPSDQSLYSRIWTYFGSNPKPREYLLAFLFSFVLTVHLSRLTSKSQNQSRTKAVEKFVIPSAKFLHEFIFSCRKRCSITSIFSPREILCYSFHLLLLAQEPNQFESSSSQYISGHLKVQCF
jgi:hypothetical protein